MEIAVAIVTLTVGTLSILATFGKVQSLLARLEARDLELRDEVKTLRLELEHAEDRLTLTTNGLKERIEHINTRVSGQVKDLSATVRAVEGFLQKNTAYERRERD